MPNIAPRNKSNIRERFLFSRRQYKIEIEEIDIIVAYDLAICDTIINLNGNNKNIKKRAALTKKNLLEKNLVKYKNGR
tara:strand:+ start:442 stop:675 length:234 start_codon:yes stop_codon:yes gene_type:complete